MRYRRFILILLIGFVSFISGGWFLQGNRGQGADVYQKARLFDQIVRVVSEYYVDSIEVNELYDMAIDGMFTQLGDPYTSFLRRESLEELSLNTTGDYGGVGIRIDSRDSWITVISPIADSPADRAGIIPGDQIVEVEGRSTRGWSTQQAAQRLRGKPDTDVSVAIIRAGVPDSLHFTLTRAQIHVNYVEGAMHVTPGVAYLRLTTVSAVSGAELHEAVSQLRAEGARGLILDLQNNPGGVLDQGVALADLFLDRNSVIVETKGRAPRATQTYRAEQPEAWPDMPVVVLVNRGTASAAEILSGAIQDHDRGIVIGTPTFGKGVAYLLIEVSDAEALTVTSSRWYTPSGRSIQRAWSAPPLTRELAASLNPSDSGQTFFSSGGRVLQAGNGGIQPDILMPPDTLTDGEQRFAEALGSNIPVYRNVLTRYALELKGRNAVSNPDFGVTDAMLAAILERLRENGVEMDDSIFYGATDLVTEEFGYELTGYAFGRHAEIRRRVMNDSRIRRAVELLEAASTPADLMALVSKE